MNTTRKPRKRMPYGDAVKSITEALAELERWRSGELGNEPLRQHCDELQTRYDAQTVQIGQLRAEIAHLRTAAAAAPADASDKASDATAWRTFCTQIKAVNNVGVDGVDIASEICLAIHYRDYGEDAGRGVVEAIKRAQNEATEDFIRASKQEDRAEQAEQALEDLQNQWDGITPADVQRIIAALGIRAGTLADAIDEIEWQAYRVRAS